MSLFLRAAFAVIVLPGVMAFLLPLVVIEPVWRREVTVFPALAIVGAGTALLLRCVREFYVAGKGTLAPWSPPKHLVVTGPFRWSRNPIYVAMLIVLIGWTVTYWSRALAVYTVVMFVAFHIRTILGEEPRLAREFGDEWRRYVRRVPRWVGFVSGGGES
jgi:protein-S-isoprenylcysteine O-methyltransferase Ste14